MTSRQIVITSAVPGKYFNIEKNIYAQLLENPDEVVTGTVKELAEKYNQEVLTMVGFLDGINDSLKVQNPIETRMRILP